MVRSTFPWVFGGTLLLLGIAIGLPALFYQPEPRQQELPWQIENANGTIRVFGVALGESSLGEAAERLGGLPVVTLFYSDEGGFALEAFFEQVNLGGLSAKMVVTVEAFAHEHLQGMFDRGVRIATLGSGTRKVTLAGADLETVMQAPVGTLTYLPSIAIPPDVLLHRFGEPAERIAEVAGDGAFVHWLYPEKGLGVAVSERQNEVLTYVPPRRFHDRVVAPLKASTAGSS